MLEANSKDSVYIEEILSVLFEESSFEDTPLAFEKIIY